MSYLQRLPEELSKAMSKTSEEFFYKHAGYAVKKGESRVTARRRRARQLAKAEAYAESRGWTFDWEEDPDGWDSLGDVPEEEVSEVLVCTLRDERGKALASLGGNLMGRNSVENRWWGRVVEAELALEAMPRSK